MLLIGGFSIHPWMIHPCPQVGSQGPHLQALQPPVPTGDSGCPHTFPGGPTCPHNTGLSHALQNTEDNIRSGSGA